MKYICIGKNYHAHAAEMGSKAPEEPMFFFKPEQADPTVPGEFPYPSFSTDVQFEAELAILIDAPLRHATEQEAGSAYSSISIGIDFTARDLQRRQKSLGFPWEICKAFEDSAPVGTWVTCPKHIQDVRFTLEVNGEVRQVGHTADMVFSVNKLLSHVSRYVTIKPGDILLTGTPEGVGQVQPGDVLKAYLEGALVLQVQVVS